MWGPSQTQTINRREYYASFTDDHNRWSRLHIQRSKDETFDSYKAYETFDSYKAYEAVLLTQFGVKIKKLHSDRDLCASSPLSLVLDNGKGPRLRLRILIRSQPGMGVEDAPTHADDPEGLSTDQPTHALPYFVKWARRARRTLVPNAAQAPPSPATVARPRQWHEQRLRRRIYTPSREHEEGRLDGNGSRILPHLIRRGASLMLPFRHGVGSGPPETPPLKVHSPLLVQKNQYGPPRAHPPRTPHAKTR
ncbi:hypothetical protein B0H14DRAFT_3865000 [Mycena olivaceomarginata]|nr:hypothetical protein B0H14DRAFT_3865000 [Mycena olivaceomarginata]